MNLKKDICLVFNIDMPVLIMLKLSPLYLIKLLGLMLLIVIMLLEICILISSCVATQIWPAQQINKLLSQTFTTLQRRQPARMLLVLNKLTTTVITTGWPVKKLMEWAMCPVRFMMYMWTNVWMLICTQQLDGALESSLMPQFAALKTVPQETSSMLATCITQTQVQPNIHAPRLSSNRAARSIATTTEKPARKME